eukprot:Gb_01569 [translate_table: standard]
MDFNFSSGLSRPGTAVFDSGVPLGTLYENPIENMQLKGIIHTESATIDIEDANPSSSEIVSAKATGNPNLTVRGCLAIQIGSFLFSDISHFLRLVSRKSSFQEDRNINDCAAEGGKGSEYIAKGIQTGHLGPLLPCSSPAKPILPLTSPIHKNGNESRSAQDMADGRFHRYRRTASFDSRKVLFLFATV